MSRSIFICILQGVGFRFRLRGHVLYDLIILRDFMDPQALRVSTIIFD